MDERTECPAGATAATKTPAMNLMLKGCDYDSDVDPEYLLGMGLLNGKGVIALFLCSQVWQW